MDQDEIVRRLEAIRERIRDRLADAPAPKLGEALPPEQPLELGEPLRNYKVPAEPNLNSSAHLEKANAAAVITGPAPLDSKVPVVGPLLTLLRRLAKPFVQPLLDPYLDRQERFNVELVRHLNELGQRLEKRLDNLGAELGHWIADPGFIESRLDAALTDYDEALKARQTVLFDALEEEVWALRSLVRDLQAGMNGQLEQFEVRFVQRAQAVDARFDEKDQALETALRTAGSSVTEAELQATRAMLRQAIDAAGRPRAGDGAEIASGPDGAPAPAVDPWTQLGSWLDDEQYRTFQDKFRGGEREIAERMQSYVDVFREPPGRVVDLGCGRGEFVALLGEAGIDAVGVEINAAEVATGVEHGLDIVHADLFDWLGDQEPESLGGVFLAEVIEHLPPPDWTRFVDLAASRLAAGGKLLVETINPESLYAYARAFVIDPTHTRPVHPELLAFLCRRAGLHEIDVRYQAEVPEEQRVAPLEPEKAGSPAAVELAREINYRIEKINRLCCAPQEYALVATRAGSASSA